MDLTSWRKHINQVVADEGQWIGVLNDRGAPRYELGGIISHTFPDRRLTSESVQVVLAVDSNPQAMLDLVGDDFTTTDSEGRLVARNGQAGALCVVRPGGRMVADIVFATLEGQAAPSR